MKTLPSPGADSISRLPRLAVHHVLDDGKAEAGAAEIARARTASTR
ncbi:MAG: hypothetical protein HC861_00630 [Rhodospirillaceae bacterium]|nr:hypothetical protein [Rhodospirillaceae bacterium]